MLPGTGILLNNGILWFDPGRDAPTRSSPGKRPLSNMCPTVVELADGRRAALGPSGAGASSLPWHSCSPSSRTSDEPGRPAAHCPRINVDGADSSRPMPGSRRGRSTCLRSSLR